MPIEAYARGDWYEYNTFSILSWWLFLLYAIVCFGN